MNVKGKSIRVCAAVVRDGAKTLLCRRPASTSHAGFWEFPGGKAAPGESDHECLRREIVEELGCRVVVMDLVFRIEHQYPDKAVSVGFYRAFPENGSGSFSPQEGQTLEWVDTEALTKMDLLPADLPVAEFLVSGVKAGNKSGAGGVIS